MNKKIWTGIFAAALTFTIGTASALAVEQQSPGRYNSAGTGMRFVDENGDGICDHYAAGDCGGGYGCGAGRQGRWHIAEDGSWVRCVDADGNGVCDTCGAKISLGAGFIDEDGDGICDNIGSGACGGGACDGTGRQGGGRGGRRSTAVN